jgi:hypothetical protein
MFAGVENAGPPVKRHRGQAPRIQPARIRPSRVQPVSVQQPQARAKRHAVQVSSGTKIYKDKGTSSGN